MLSAELAAAAVVPALRGRLRVTDPAALLAVVFGVLPRLPASLEALLCPSAGPSEPSRLSRFLNARRGRSVVPVGVRGELLGPDICLLIELLDGCLTMPSAAAARGVLLAPELLAAETPSARSIARPHA